MIIAKRNVIYFYIKIVQDKKRKKFSELIENLKIKNKKIIKNNKNNMNQQRKILEQKK